MKIIDETGAVVENPDLMLGYLTDDTQPLEHPAQEAVAEVAHYETVAEYPSGGRDVQRVVDVPGVPAKPAWTEQLPIKRYIRYTAEELAAQEEARKKQEAKDKLPELGGSGKYPPQGGFLGGALRQRAGLERHLPVQCQPHHG